MYALVWSIRYQASSGNCSCQSVFWFSCVCVCVWVWIRYQALLATCSCQSVFCLSCVCALVWIRYWASSATCGCQSVFCFSRMCVHRFRSDIGLRQLLVAVSLCSVSVVHVCAWVWIRYWALSATCSCQSVFCSSGVCVRALVWIRYWALSAMCGCQTVLFQLRVRWFESDIRLRQLLVAVSLCSLSVVCVCVCVCVGLDQISGFVGYLWLSVCILFQLCKCVCVCWLGSDIGLCQLLVAVSLFCFSCVCVGLDQMSGFVGCS